MAFWLIKSEPSVYSWENFQVEGTTAWEGVRNYPARLNLSAMRTGDNILFYHSNIGMQIVGICEVVKESYPDKTDKTGKFVAVDVKALRKLKAPVSLGTLKADKRFADMDLIRLGRLSVQKVKPAEWSAIMMLAGEK